MPRFPFFKCKRHHASASVTQSPIEIGEQHAIEREQFQSLLESFQVTRIPERLNVLDLFLSTERHLTLNDLGRIVGQKAPQLADHDFLSETMEMFCRYGLAQKQSFENQDDVYEHHHLGMHHDHFICTRCGKIQEFINHDLEQLQMRIARDFQFHPLQHKMEIYGICSGCMAQRQSAIPLRLAAEGERVRIIEFAGGREITARLGDMGLAVGVCLEVISNHPSGQVIVAVEGTRLAITADISQLVLVAHSCRHKEPK